MAGYLKREFGDMMDEKSGAKIKKIDEKLLNMAVTTDEGFQSMQQQLDQETKDRV